MSTAYDDVRGADPIAQPPVLAPGHTPASVTERISEAVTTKTKVTSAASARLTEGAGGSGCRSSQLSSAAGVAYPAPIAPQASA